MKSPCVNLEMSWTIAILHLHSREADLCMKVIMMHANMTLFDLLQLNTLRNVMFDWVMSNISWPKVYFLQNGNLFSLYQDFR